MVHFKDSQLHGLGMANLYVVWSQIYISCLQYDVILVVFAAAAGIHKTSTAIDFYTFLQVLPYVWLLRERAGQTVFMSLAAIFLIFSSFKPIIHMKD